MKNILNRRYLSNDHEKEEVQNSFLDGLFYGEANKKSLYQLEKDIIEHGMNPSIEVELEKLVDDMPKANEILFLRNIKYEKIKSFEKVEQLAKDYDVSSTFLEKMIKNKELKVPTENEINFMLDIQGCDSRIKDVLDHKKSIWNITDKHYQDLKDQGHINVPDDNEILAFSMHKNNLPKNYIQFITKISDYKLQEYEDMEQKDLFSIQCRPYVLVNNPLPENINLWKIKRDSAELKMKYQRVVGDELILIKSEVDKDSLNPIERSRLNELKAMGICRSDFYNNPDPAEDKSIFYYLNSSLKTNKGNIRSLQVLGEKSNSLPKINEIIFLQEFNYKKIDSENSLLEHAAKYDLGPDDIARIVRNGNLTILSSEEISLLENINREDLREIDKASSELFKSLVKSRHIQVPSDEDILNYKISKMKIDIKETQEITGLSEERINDLRELKEKDFFKITTRPYYLSKNTLPEEIKIVKIKENSSEAKKYYQYYRYDADIIYEKEYKGVEKLNSYQVKRLNELEAMDISINDFYLPSTNEIKLLEKINHRKEDLDLVYKVAQKDFNINKSQVDNLFSLEYIKIKDGKIKTQWVDPKLVYLARSSLYTKHENIIKNEKLHPDLVKKVKGIESLSPLVPEKRMIKDVKIFFKILNNEPLKRKDNFRINQLIREGINPNKEYSHNFFLEDTGSWRIKEELKNQMIASFKNKNSINMPALTMVNTFKQISHNGLFKLGLSEDDILQYTNGFPKNIVYGDSKLLIKNILSTPLGPLPYYSLQHQGHISGRSLLKFENKNIKINKRPQQRQDLLFHDLKAADSVIDVKEQLDKSGIKISEIKNESTLFSQYKKGVPNNQRQNSPHVMDAQIILEKPTIITVGNKLVTATTIGVEYGNYSPARMGDKLQHSQYDIAYVYSNKTCQLIYQRKFDIPRPIEYRTI